MGGDELLAEQAPEEARKDPHGQEVTAPAGDPSLAIRRDPAPRRDAVHVRVMGQGRAPGVQHQGEPDACSQVLGVGGDGEQGLGGSLEQKAIDHRFVGEGDLADRRRQREHQMIVVHRQ